MAIVFPKSEFWPLPPDYPQLDGEGQRLARLNACHLGGTPELEVASWHFFREYYLIPTPKGFFYKHGSVKSPKAHYDMVYHWSKYPLTATEAPRSFAKSTLTRERVVKKLLTQPYKETLLFLAKQDFIRPFVDIIMLQITENQRIIEDFGVLKPKKGSGSWAHGFIKLTNGGVLQTLPIRGAVLGPRPHEILLDDVEKDEHLLKNPSALEEHIEAARQFFFNAIFPMAEEGVPIHIIGTKVHDRSFIHYLVTTDDPKITGNFFRTLLKAEYVEADGSSKLIWREKLSREWLDRQRSIMGEAAFAMQYLNESGSDTHRAFNIHPQLNTYWLTQTDEAAYTDPFSSHARMVTHQLDYWDIKPGTDERVPVPNKIERPWTDVLQNMRRIITVDYAETTTSASDYSCVHVLGLENTEVHRNTLYSLDIWIGRVTREELVRRIFHLARRWKATIIGIEQYPVLLETSERIIGDVRDLFRGKERMPAVIPIKFPTSLSKADKIKGLSWRFNQFRLKLPLDREQGHSGYRALFDQIRRFTPDMALLRYDDALDTLAMHQGIGKPLQAAAADVNKPRTAMDHLKAGIVKDEETGVNYLSAVNASEIDADTLRKLREQGYDYAEEEGEGHVQWTSQALF